MIRADSSAHTPMRRDGLIDQTAAKFRAEIISGRWPVGSRIPPEVDLVPMFGIGRNTMREALQSLVQGGLLRREQGRGTFVISDSELTGPMERQLAGGTRRHYLELRLALDSTAAALAARRRNDDDIATLRELRDSRADSWTTDDKELQASTDVALHRAVVVATHNPLYLQLYTSMLEVFTAHVAHDENHDETPSLQQHHDLVEAIADGDPEQAAAVVNSIFDPLM